MRSKGWEPKAGGPTFKVHLDGYNQLPYLTGQEPLLTDSYKLPNAERT